MSRHSDVVSGAVAALAILVSLMTSTSSTYANPMDLHPFILSVERVTARQVPIEGTLPLPDEAAEGRAEVELFVSDYRIEVGDTDVMGNIEVKTLSISSYDIHVKGGHHVITLWMAQPPHRVRQFRLIESSDGKTYLTFAMRNGMTIINIDELSDDKIVSLVEFVATPPLGATWHVAVAASIGVGQSSGNWGVDAFVITGNVHSITVLEDDQWKVEIADADGELHSFVGKGYQWSPSE